jgi:hypothetical protein
LRKQLEIRQEKHTCQFSPTNINPGPKFESSKQRSPNPADGTALKKDLTCMTKKILLSGTYLAKKLDTLNLKSDRIELDKNHE